MGSCLRDVPGLSLNSCHLWCLHTAGAAQSLGVAGAVDNLVPGAEADFVVLNPQATPLLARCMAAAKALDELLFAFSILADDRAVVDTFFS